jgi:hypothetical protein
MENLIDTIRAAIANDASAESGAAGAHACRTILAAIETQAGEPLTSAPPPTTPVQAALVALSKAPPEQLLDMVIAKLRSVLPTGAEVAPVQSVRIPLLPIATRGAKS